MSFKINSFKGVGFMSRRIRVKHSKPLSLLGMIVGIALVFIGIFTAIPQTGMFGVFWTLTAVGITVFQAYNFFSNKGVASWEIDVDEGSNIEKNNRLASASGDFETRLRKLNKLKEDGLITEEEFRMKREELLREKW